MARLVLITFAFVSVTAVSTYAPRQSTPKVQPPQQQQYQYQQQQPQQYQYQQQQPQQYQYQQQPQQYQYQQQPQQYQYQQHQVQQSQAGQYHVQQSPSGQYQIHYQQPLPRPLTEVLSSNMLVQMADLVGGRPSAIPPTLGEDSGRRSPFNHLAARQAIAITDSQQVGGVRGKAADSPVASTARTHYVPPNMNKNTACARAIVVCCKPPSTEVRYGCFEALGCPGFFLSVNPCSSSIVSELAH